MAVMVTKSAGARGVRVVELVECAECGELTPISDDLELKAAGYALCDDCEARVANQAFCLTPKGWDYVMGAGADCE